MQNRAHARRGALVAVVALVALALSFQGPAAQASALPPTPVVVGETLAVPAGVVAVDGGATALANGMCAVLGAETAGVACGIAYGALGVLALYATRDKWLPVAEKVWNKLFGSVGGAAGCAVLLDNIIPTADGRGVITTITTNSGCDYFGQARDTGVQQVGNGFCVKGSTVTAFGASSGTAGGMALQSMPSGGSVLTYAVTNLCPPGWTVGFVALRAVWDWYNGRGISDIVRYGTLPPDASFSQVTSVDCKDLTGDIHTITASQVGKPGQIVVPSCADAYPGSVPVGYNVKGGWPGAEQSIASQTLTDPRTSYPDCFDAGGHLLDTCRVRVFIDGQPCTVGMSGCNDPRTWHEDHPGSEISCHWGPYVVAFTNCDPLLNHYGGQSQTVTDTDPKTGGPVLDPTTPPTPKTQLPDWLDKICMIGCTPPEPKNPEPPTAPDTASCMSEAKSWNPTHWVFVPVKCALVWAFVPKNAPPFTDLANPIPVGWIPSLPSPPDKGCGVVSFPRLDTGYAGLAFGPSKIIDTCDAPWPTVRNFTYYGVLALVMVPLGFKAFNMVLSALGLYLGVEADVEARGGWHPMSDYS